MKKKRKKGHSIDSILNWPANVCINVQQKKKKRGKTIAASLLFIVIFIYFPEIWRFLWWEVKSILFSFSRASGRQKNIVKSLYESNKINRGIFNINFQIFFFFFSGGGTWWEKMVKIWIRLNSSADASRLLQIYTAVNWYW